MRDRTAERIPVKVTDPMEMARTLALREGEREDDLLSVYDAMQRYCVSRTALRNAALKEKIPHQWVGSQRKQIMLMKRGDIMAYIGKPIGKNELSRPVAWRTSYKDDPSLPLDIHAKSLS
jgi:hypothetical protein